MRTPSGQLGAIIFDFDGTLIDASRAIIHSFNAALRRKRYAEWPEDRIRSVIGRPLQEMFARATGSDDPVELESLIVAYREHFLPAGVPLSRPLPGTLEVVRHFSSRVPLAIATSRHSDGAVRILEGLGLLSHFSAIVGLEQVQNPKPHPESVLQALHRVGATAENSVMVGDTADDITAGKQAGTLAVGVTGGAHSREQLEEAGADFIVEHLADLIGILGNGFSRRGAEARREGREAEEKGLQTTQRGT